MNNPYALWAHNILEGFHRHFEHFQQVTRQAQALFETAQWAEIHRQSLVRLDYYKKDVLETIAGMEAMDAPLRRPDSWPKVREEYRHLIESLVNRELAETFFNSIYCCIFDHREISNAAMFVHASYPPANMTAEDNIIFQDIIFTYTLDGQFISLIESILSQPAFALPYENKNRDIQNIVTTLTETLLPTLSSVTSIKLEILKPLFFRNKGTYIVGRLVHHQGITPFVIPIINNEKGAIYVDAVIYDPDDVSIIFSFTRSYFMVEAPVPLKIIMFLKTLMPQKGLAELYNAIGLNKHGKTEFYRSFIDHLEHSEDKFILAPGIKGMVMSVFTLPSYDIVFKIIKDHFDPPKDMTREMVKEKYRLVSRHDRVGRMSDTQEYSYFHFPRQRFSDELIAELQSVAASSLEFTDSEIIIKHLYTERRMTPLNLYLGTATPEQTEEVMDEYGNAIKQIASANIFPGDMLLKNFGVTRHGRVVFYDYDEICFLDECHFRVIPEPQNEEQAMSLQPWYNVGVNDIFPEEFRLFFTGNPTARRMFEKHHSDLYQASFWQNLQKNIAAGKVEDMFPYRRKKRFVRSN
jgi:isocitrate dehydrogenase kinase/phosphatase